MPVCLIACVPCRDRKVKCNGGVPRCDTCIRKNRELECIYEKPRRATSRRKASAERRVACLPCRRKKKRCNGDQPFCSTCQSRGMSLECVYDSASLRKSERRNNRQTTPTLKPMPKSWSVPVGPSNLDDLVDPVNNISRLTIDDSALPLIHSPVTHGAQIFFAPRDLSSFPSMSDTWNSPSHFNPSQAALPPTVGRSIAIRNSFNSISLPDPFEFALSNLSPDDMGMTFRILFLIHRFQLGIYLPFDKQQAILFGDLSNTIIHPFFVHYASCFGCHLYHERPGFPFSYVHIQSQYVQLFTQHMFAVREEDDPFRYIQVYEFIATGSLHSGLIVTTKRILRRVLDAVVRNNLRFVPSRSQMFPTLPELSESVHERAVCLAQLIYIQVHVDLADGDPLEGHGELEEQFRNELPEAYPVLFQICPIIIRVKSILFAKDARCLITLYKQQPTPQSMWMLRDRFLPSLIFHINDLETRIGDFKTDMRGGEGCLSLKYSIIICLTTLAEVYDSLGSPGYLDAIQRIVEVVRNLKSDDYRFFDAFARICFDRVISLLQKEQSFLPVVFTPDGPTATLEPVPIDDTIQFNLGVLSKGKAILDTITRTSVDVNLLLADNAYYSYHKRPLPKTEDAT